MRSSSGDPAAEVYGEGEATLFESRAGFDDARLQQIPDAYAGYLNYLQEYVDYLRLIRRDIRQRQRAAAQGIASEADVRYPNYWDVMPGIDPSAFPNSEAVEAALRVHRETLERIQRFEEKIEAHYPISDQRAIKKALMLATVGHQQKSTPKGRLRKSDGAPYINHPIAMAEKLLDIHLQSPTGIPPRASALCALLLHDIPEDVPIELTAEDEAAGNTCKGAWLDVIEREFDTEGQGKVLREVIDGVTEREVPPDIRAQIRGTPLHKMIVAFVQRGGVMRPRKNAGSLSQRQLETVDHAVYNLERLFRAAVQSPEHMIALLVKILDLWQNFDTIGLVKLEKVLRGRIAAATALQLGYPELSGEIITAMATVTNTNTPYSPDLAPTEAPTSEVMQPEFIEKRLTGGKVTLEAVFDRVRRLLEQPTPPLPEEDPDALTTYLSRLSVLLRDNMAEIPNLTVSTEVTPSWHLMNPRDEVISTGWVNTSLPIPEFHLRQPAHQFKHLRWRKDPYGDPLKIRTKIDETRYRSSILTLEPKGAPEEKSLHRKMGREYELLQCRIDGTVAFLIDLRSDEPTWKDAFQRDSGVDPETIPESRLFHNRLGSIPEQARQRLGPEKIDRMQQTHIASLLGFLYDPNLPHNTCLMQLDGALFFTDPNLTIDDYVIALMGRTMHSGDDTNLWIERQERLSAIDKYGRIGGLGLGWRNMAERIFSVKSDQVEIARELNRFTHRSLPDLIVSYMIEAGPLVNPATLARQCIAGPINADTFTQLTGDAESLAELKAAIAHLFKLGGLQRPAPDEAYLREFLDEVRKEVVRQTDPYDVAYRALYEFYSTPHRDEGHWQYIEHKAQQRVREYRIPLEKIRALDSLSGLNRLEAALSKRFPEGRVQPWRIDKLIAALIRNSAQN